MGDKIISKNNEIVMIAPLGEPQKRVRLQKMIRIFANNYQSKIYFWGWKRNENESLGVNMPEISGSKTIIKGGGYRSKILKLYYLFYVIRVFFMLLIYAPKRVYCLGFETALPAWLASIFRPRIRYLFDDADRFVLLLPFPKFFEKIIVFLEKKVSQSSVCHIIPTFERYPYRNDKQFEVANLPDSSSVIEAKKRAHTKKQGKLWVYVNGWLDATRGLNLLDSCAGILEKEAQDIHFSVAVGNLTTKDAPFLKRKNVNLLGSLSQAESLAYYPAHDVVVTFYDPKVRINRYALPNKWGDALVMGCPVICNEEIITARPFLDAGAAFGVPFNDPSALADLLKKLTNSSEEVLEAKNSMITLRGKFINFDEAMDKILPKFID